MHIMISLCESAKILCFKWNTWRPMGNCPCCLVIKSGCGLSNCFWSLMTCLWMVFRWIGAGGLTWWLRERWGGSDTQPTVTTGSASSSVASIRTPAADCARSAADSGSGCRCSPVDNVDGVTSQRGATMPDRRRSVDMATTDHTRPELQHELTYSDMGTPKGLCNRRGENNCFLNSAVQVTDVHPCLYRRCVVQRSGSAVLCAGYIFDSNSTAVRLLIRGYWGDRLTVTQPASHIHADLFIYLGRSAGCAAAHTQVGLPPTVVK